MFPIHDPPLNVQSIVNEISNNLYDAKLVYYSSNDILNSVQDQYNKLVSIMCPIEKSTFIPNLAEPYYNLGSMIADYMYCAGLFNPYTNLWLEGLTYKQMKATYQTYLAIGQPKWINIVDFSRILVWPYQPGATGVLFLCYKASAPQITPDHIPQLPYSSGAKLLELMSTADLFEQAREFKKAARWWARALEPDKTKQGTKSLYEQCFTECKDLARMDKERVLEPYRWIFHGGQFLSNNWITGETPAGTINGVNTTFTLSQVPNPTNSLMLMLNGQVLVQGIGYTLNGQTITFQTGFIPQLASVNIPNSTNDTIQAWYQVN